MKFILLSLFVGLIMVGCGESSTPFDPVDSPKAIDLNDKQTRDKIIAEAIDEESLTKPKKGGLLIFDKNGQTPYTGWMKATYPSGKIRVLAQLKDGKPDGLWTWWYVNGQMKMKINYKNGKQVGLSNVWYENGQKRLARNYKDAKPHGLSTSWYENGQKESEGNFKDGKMEGFVKRWRKKGLISEEGYWIDGKIMSVGMWKPNGEKCPVTNLKDGNGLVTGYYDNGQRTGVGKHMGGRFMSATVFKPNGEKCPVTNLRNGNGVVVWYDEEGSEKSRRNFKNGELVED